MDFNLTIDKKVQAAVQTALCINCGKCGDICPTGALKEHQKTVSCTFADCGEGKGADIPVRYPAEAKAFSSEVACSLGCPLGIVPQAVAACIKDGNIDKAYELIVEKNPLPWICSQVCDNFCRDMCKRGVLIDEPLNMPALESYVLSRVQPKDHRYMRRAAEKIAIIGGGPAGITAAFDLSKLGYGVTIFERDDRLGGAMSWGIPEFKLDKRKMAEEINSIIKPGIDVRYNCSIGEDLTLEQIWDEGFDACLIATGTSCGIMADIPGAAGPMVYDAVDVMRSMKRQEFEPGEKVLVIGRGALAADMARSIVRAGKNVVYTSLESVDELQLSREELERMAAEGIELKTLIAPKQIIREGTVLKAVEFVNTEYIEDERGVLRPHMIKGSEFNMFCDTVIFALGCRSDVESISKVETYPDGRVKIDARHRTNKNMIFACGDVTGESGSVVEAMAAGRQAALQIDNAVRGRLLPDREHVIFGAPDEETIYPANIEKIRPQYRQMIIEGVEVKQAEYVDDILPVLRSAGIEENMPKLCSQNSDGKKAAIAGGGIAGITAAITLAKKGYRPTIFEKYSQLGGSYRWLTTDRRIDKALLKRELAKVEASGIEVVYNATVGLRPSFAELARMGYEAVLFAIGESAGKKPQFAGVNYAGVFDIVTLMGKLADEEILPDVGRRVIIVGSDEMAFDIARRLNQYCDEVTLLAPCSRGGLQVATSAVNVALEEGINITTGVELSRINAEDGRLRSVDFKILQSRLSENMPCDTLVLGGTGRPETDIIKAANAELEIDDNGYLVIDDKLSTAIRGVFAIGNFKMSSADAGRAGAAAVENFLADGGLSIDVEFNGEKEMAVTHEKLAGNKEILGGFEAGRRDLNEAQTLIEASRCIKCGYHRENAASCMGCGVCVRICPVNAITLAPVDAGEPGKWPNVKDIDEYIGRDSIFAGEVE